MRHLQASSAGNPETARGEGGFSPPPRASEGVSCRPAPWPGTSSPQSCERGHLCYRKPPGLWPFLWQPRETGAGRLRNWKPRSSVLAWLCGESSAPCRVNRTEDRPGTLAFNPRPTTHSLRDLGLLPGNAYLCDVAHAGPCFRGLFGG